MQTYQAEYFPSRDFKDIENNHPGSRGLQGKRDKSYRGDIGVGTPRKLYTMAIHTLTVYNHNS